MNMNSFQTSKKQDFISEEQVREALRQMEQDATLNTDPVLIRNIPGSARSAPFEQRHLTYLKEHPKVDPEDYLSNLRTVLRIRHN